jgi:hypothetical protein
MTNLKRILCLVLVLVFAAGLISCDQNTNKPSNTDPSDTTPKEENPFSGLDYKGASFVIQTSVNVDTASYNSSNYLIQGSDEGEADRAANSAIKRNKKVESDLNVKLTFFESDYNFDEVGSKIRELIKANADEIHLIINDISALNLSTEGLYHDNLYGQYFDFSKPYWYDGLMESASLNTNTRYMLAGDYFIDVTRHSHCLIMNKDYYEEIGCDPESVYQIVRDGEWTLDKLYTIVRGGEDGAHPTYQDYQGNHKRDRRDKWGLVLWQWWGPMIPWLTTSDPGYITRDENGYPEITVNNERTLALCDKLTALFNAEETAVGIHNDNQDTIDSFVEGKILFLTYQRLGNLESEIYANTEVNLAVLPYPKLDESQKDYISTIHDTTEVGFIPSNVAFQNMPFVSAVIEYLSQISADTVMQDYYEWTLKIRYARESANAEMIQLIHDTYGNAFTLVWSLGEGGNIFNTGLYNSISKNQSVFASFYRSIENSAKNQLASLIADDEIVREQMQREYAASGLSK